MGCIVDTQSSTRDLADMALAKRLAEVLDKHYPGHLWGVTVNSSQGIATIMNLRLSGRWGFLLKLRDLTYEDEIARETKRAGGELLERYRLSRGAFQESEFEGLPSTPLGDHIADVSDKRTARRVGPLPPTPSEDLIADAP